jgi:hypothetical protein
MACNLSQQRAYQIVCLMVGSDPVKFKDLASPSLHCSVRKPFCVFPAARTTSNPWGSIPSVLKPGHVGEATLSMAISST